MSDRIDELVALIRPLLYPYGVADNSLTELATIARDEWKKPRSCPSCGEYMVHIDTAEIVQQETAEYVLRAREAEAMCEWLAGKVSDRDALAATRDGGSFRSPDDWLAAAREAVKQDER